MPKVRQILTPCSWFPAAPRRPFSPLPFLVRGFLAGKKGTRFDPKNPTIPHLSPGKCNCSTGLTTCFSFKKKQVSLVDGFKLPPFHQGPKQNPTEKSQASLLWESSRWSKWISKCCSPPQRRVWPSAAT